MELSTEKVLDCEREKDHDMMLDLSLSEEKSENLFAGSDQTPTPTRLIRNCEEVGLFEDLRHVNPFDETFRRACEQSNGLTPMRQLDSVEAQADENSLHTPQVYSQLEAIQSCEMLSKALNSPSSTAVTLDVPAVDDLVNAAADAYKIGTSRQNSNTSTTSSTIGYGKIYKYRTIAERPTAGEVLINETRVPSMQLPNTTAIQLIQPQLITLTFPDNNDSKNLANNLEAKPLGNTLSANAIPIQTVKPFIMPKLAPASAQTSIPTTATSTTSVEIRSTITTTKTKQLPPLTTKTNSSSLANTCTNTAKTTQSLTIPTQQHEPSSASLTPTSQLPIKERLKAILSLGNKTHTPSQPLPPIKTNSRRSRHAVTSSSTTGKYDEDSMVRRRAAATRYRNKMRNEHKELKRRNVELQSENEKLRSRIKQLEQDLIKSQQPQQTTNGNLLTVPTQVQIPPSTLHLVMNIPTMVVPANGQPSLVQPITYRVEKK